MTNEERHIEVKRLGVCLECTSLHRCNVCKRRQHTIIHHPPTSRLSVFRPLPEFQNIQNMNRAQLKEIYPNVSFNLPMLAKEFDHLWVRDSKDDEEPMYPRTIRRPLVTRITQPIFRSHQGELIFYILRYTHPIGKQQGRLGSAVQFHQNSRRRSTYIVFRWAAS